MPRSYLTRPCLNSISLIGATPSQRLGIRAGNATAVVDATSAIGESPRVRSRRLRGARAVDRHQSTSA